MWNAATYKPDPLITAAAEWARGQGLANNEFSIRRTTTGAEILNCRCDMVTVMATIQETHRNGRTHEITRI